MIKRKGFTLIELMLFLGVTAALFLGVTIGVQNSVSQQKYNDSVQTFLEFMRGIYSKVSNPQSSGKGNSDLAIYGKLIVFGEDNDVNGNAIDKDDGMQIFSYDVVGRADTNISTGSVSELLVDLEANVVLGVGADAKSMLLTGGNIPKIQRLILAAPEKFEMHWGAIVEDKDGKPFTGSILVVRHPRSGTINTLVLDGGSNDVIQANDVVKVSDQSGFSSVISLLTSHLITTGTAPKFVSQEVNFCINPYESKGNNSVPRQNIRLLNNARNASSVQMIGLDDADNKCK
ncbi:MAG: hypothetical protein Q4B87_02410 [Candidatus Saccharibacteria bacterium]|nr:hypothetical protein [Candidatus Saccharibacteria bacterium]